MQSMCIPAESRFTVTLQMDYRYFNIECYTFHERRFLSGLDCVVVIHTYPFWLFLSTFLFQLSNIYCNRGVGNKRLALTGRFPVPSPGTGHTPLEVSGSP